MSCVQQVLNHLLYLLKVSDKAVQRRVAVALAHLCSDSDQRLIFVKHNGECWQGMHGVHLAAHIAVKWLAWRRQVIGFGHEPRGGTHSRGSSQGCGLVFLPLLHLN